MEIDPSGDTDPWLESVIDGIDDVTPTSSTMMKLYVALFSATRVELLTIS